MLGVLPRLIDAAHNRDLKAAFTSRVEISKLQRQRLDWILGAHGRRLNGHVCRGMHGVLEDVNAVLRLGGEGPVLDAAIIASVRRIDYYMMAGYLAALSLAVSLDLLIEAEALQESLFVEEAVDDLLKDACEYIPDKRRWWIDSLQVQ